VSGESNFIPSEVDSMKTTELIRDFDPDDHFEEISEVAYSYWESRGREHGHDVDDWVMAEQEVIRRHSTQSADLHRQANAA
jgi:hypothetical protein